jgi:hypothetical protein
MKNYFEEFYNRYEELKSELKLTDINSLNKEIVKAIIEKNAQGLNNLVMAGLGMGTLYLRMGAVLMIAEKTKPDAEKDVSFLKVIAEKLIHKLPADGEWKDIWNAYLSNNNQGEWNQILENSPQKKAYELFVSFRNNIVHQDIIIQADLPDSIVDRILNGLKNLDAMSKFVKQFTNSIISLENNEVYFQYQNNSEKLKISPYVQINKSNEPEEVGILPYIFQGRYYKGAKFINTDGAETKEEKDDSLDETFDSIKKEIARFNGDKAFDFKEKIDGYNEWCIGREDEVNAILDWINNSETDKNVLPIFAPAGMGKGALIAEVIKELKGKQPMMFHFCGSGKNNNLHSVLYHFILQGKNMPGMNGVSIWESNDEKINSRLQKFPSQYVDTITLFQNLLSNCISLPQSHKGKALVIILDGLDEAAVADQSKRISDWFYKYKDDASNADDIRSKRSDKWISPKHIKWIFTFRYLTDESRKIKQFDYPNEIKAEFNIEENESLQPLKPLNISAEELNKALMSDLKEQMNENAPTLTDDFIKAILEKGKTKDKVESPVK